MGLEVDGAAAAAYVGRATDETEEEDEAGAFDADLDAESGAEMGRAVDADFALARVSTGEPELLTGASADFAGGIDCGLWGCGALCK
jgi:hypothetical protein